MQTRKTQGTAKKKKGESYYLIRRSQLKDFMTEGSTAPFLKGKIKLHKKDLPLREISDATNSPGHNLAKVLNKVFSSYTNQTDRAINGGNDLIKQIKDGRFNKGFLGSLDAVALYPSIHLEEAFELLEVKIRQDPNLQDKTDLEPDELLELAKLCAENPYFECEKGFYQQEGGTPMGGPLSRLLADLVIEEKIEKQIAEHPKWGAI